MFYATNCFYFLISVLQTRLHLSGRNANECLFGLTILHFHRLPLEDLACKMSACSDACVQQIHIPLPFPCIDIDDMCQNDQADRVRKYKWIAFDEPWCLDGLENQ
jgi:hypothetical protein